MVSVSFGNQWRRACSRVRRENMVDSAPSIFTGTTGAPDFSSASKLDLDSPFQHTAEELAKTYRLESAEWRWTPEPRNFLLRLPEESPHTVLLWLVDETKPGAKARWVMMVAGDESPLIQAHEPGPDASRLKSALFDVGLLLGLLILLVGGALAFRRRSLRG